SWPTATHKAGTRTSTPCVIPIITAVGKAGASPKVHQESAGHSTYAMTGRYTHARLHDLVATVAALPPLLSSPDAGKEAVAATGTEGKPVESPAHRTTNPEKLGNAPKLREGPGGQLDILRAFGTEQQEAIQTGEIPPENLSPNLSPRG